MVELHISSLLSCRLETHELHAFGLQIGAIVFRRLHSLGFRGGGNNAEIGGHGCSFWAMPLSAARAVAFGPGREARPGSREPGSEGTRPSFSIIPRLQTLLSTPRWHRSALSPSARSH